MKKFKTYLKYGFYTYLIFLAFYINASFLLKGRFGRQRIKFTPPNQECFQGGENWRYCVYDTARDSHDTILYFFHGKDQDETFWMDDSQYPALIQQYWQKKRRKTPKVVSVSFGPAWFVSPKMSGDETGLLEKFKNEVFGIVEQKVGAPRRRFLLGASMGGLNALNLGLYLPKYFSRVASLCPPIYEVSPFSSWATLLGVVTDNGAVPKSLITAMGIGRYLLKDEEEWKKFSPLEIIQADRFNRLPPMYISAGLWDEYGVYSGTARFVQEARKRGAKVYWRPNSGEHCAIDIPSLSKFLSL